MHDVHCCVHLIVLFLKRSWFKCTTCYRILHKSHDIIHLGVYFLTIIQDIIIWRIFQQLVLIEIEGSHIQIKDCSFNMSFFVTGCQVTSFLRTGHLITLQMQFSYYVEKKSFYFPLKYLFTDSSNARQYTVHFKSVHFK